MKTIMETLYVCYNSSKTCYKTDLLEQNIPTPLYTNVSKYTKSCEFRITIYGVNIFINLNY